MKLYTTMRQNAANITPPSIGCRKIPTFWLRVIIGGGVLQLSITTGCYVNEFVYFFDMRNENRSNTSKL